MKRILIFAVLVFVSWWATTNVVRAAGPEAGDVSIMTFIGSYHFNRDNDYCEINPGLGIQYFYSDSAYLVAGAYKNSPCNTAPFLMVGTETNPKKKISFGFSGGVVGGYDRDDVLTAPFIIIPYIRFGSYDDKVHAKVTIIPTPNGVIGLALSWKLD